MTSFDVAIIAVLLVSGFLAFIRGFVNEILSILAWVIAALSAVWLYPVLTPILRAVISPEWLAAALAALIIFIAIYVVVSLLSYRLAARIHEFHEHVGVLDRTLGFIFGVVRGLVVAAIAYLFFVWLVPTRDEHPGWIREARTLPLVEATSSVLLALTPGDDARLFGPTGGALSSSDERPGMRQSDADTGDGTGYKSSERRGLDRLFESTTEK